MIVDPKILAVMKRPSITAIETPMHSSEQCLLTVANRISGKSKVGSKPALAGIGGIQFLTTSSTLNSSQRQYTERKYQYLLSRSAIFKS
jgi:hypothetical protein